MANSCYSEIDIFSKEHPNELALLDKRLSEWTKGSWSESWLGNVLIQSELVSKEAIEENESPYRCRGHIISNDMDSADQLHISTETAWVPMMAMWPAICEKFGIDDAKIIFSAEEPGFDVYITNDQELLAKPYIFDGCFEGEDEYLLKLFESDTADIEDHCVAEDFIDEKRLNNVFEKIKEKIPEIESLNDLQNHLKDDESYFNLHKFEEGGVIDY